MLKQTLLVLVLTFGSRPLCVGAQAVRKEVAALPDTLARSDSVAIRKAAATHLGPKLSSAIVVIRGDTATVRTPWDRGSDMVTVVRRGGLWTAVEFWVSIPRDVSTDRFPAPPVAKSPRT